MRELLLASTSPLALSAGAPSPPTELFDTVGFQTYTVPTTGWYSIQATGAEGGLEHWERSQDSRGGSGAQVSGNFYLTANEQLSIAVGAHGYNGPEHKYGAAGGGGGSFVVGPGNAPLLIAGGGGGGGGSPSTDGVSATNSTSGTAGVGSGAGQGAADGNGGFGGQSTYTSLVVGGAGGGGFLGSGGQGIGFSSYNDTLPSGGYSFLAGLAGGAGGSTSGVGDGGAGGFGGGGGGAGGTADLGTAGGGGGGGGGYSGGGGGGGKRGTSGSYGGQGGGAGGSFNAGLSQKFTTINTPSGNGSVVINLYGESSGKPLPKPPSLGAKTWQGRPPSTSWFDASNWGPPGVPQPGDQIVISSAGGPTVGADSTTPPPLLDGEQVTLGGTDFASPATITSDGATFGRGFAITTRADAPYAALDFTGPTVFNGTITAVGAQVGIETAGTDLQGSGTTLIAKGSTVSFTGAVPGTQTVSFLDPNGTLVLNDPATFAAQITGFQAGDRIQLGGSKVAVSATYADGTLTLTGEGGAPIATLNLAEAGSGPLAFHVKPFGHGGSVITTSNARRVWSGGTGDWFDPASWKDGVPPLGGDTALITGGTAVISAADAAAYGTLDFETIVLGAADGSAPVYLQSSDAAFGSGTTITTRGTPQYVPDFIRPEETWVASGTTRFDGTLLDQAFGGMLTIDVTSAGLPSSLANFVITGFPNPSETPTETFATLFVGQESRLAFIGEAGSTVTNNGLILVDGHADIGHSVSLAGTGTVELEAGGSIAVAGSVGTGQTFQFGSNGYGSDRGTLRISDLPDFRGLIAVGDLGDTINLTSIQAQGFSYDSGTSTLTLDGADGQQLGQLAVTDPNGIGASDFTLASDGQTGSRITYTPQGPVTLHESLPVPAVATTGTLIPMADLLVQAFGSVPAGYASYTLSAPLGKLASESYWQQPPGGTPADSAWYYDGQPITQATTVSASDLAHVSYYAGNNIYRTPSFTVPVAADASSGNTTELIQYNVWTVDPAVNAPETGSGPTTDTPPDPGSRFGQVDPSDIVASAYRYNSAYPGVLNYNDCNWIADNLTAGAGAAMPYNDASTDPSQNEPGGFWRVAYRGSDAPNPVRNWSTLTQPGDVVRMGRLGEVGEHTTTVVGPVNADGSLPVYDNGDHNAQGENIIGVHDATYWTGTDPGTITIYRLDPNHQYLIQGTNKPEFIQGSVFDNLIHPGGGSDTITAGTGNNEIQDITAHLDGITVTDFHFGDTLDFTDLGSGDATAGFSDGVLTVSGGQATAAITLLGQPGDASFLTSSDGHGGTLVGLAPSRTT